MDFDGVLTDNRVWVTQNGEEAVAANRSDSLGLALLLEQKKVASAGYLQGTQPGG